MEHTFPEKIQLANLPTSIDRLNRISRMFDVNVFVKRDDMTGGPESGNKIRKLEYVLAHARREGCDTIITCGAADSNHCRATAIACARLGLQCILLLREPRNQFTGNLFLDHFVHADVRHLSDRLYYERLDQIKDEIIAEVESSGHRAMWVPSGASNAIGALGYVECAAEISAYQQEHDMEFDRIYFASGSGGTAAGLTVGKRVYGLKAQVVGINTDGDEEELSLFNRTVEIANGCAYELGLDEMFSFEDVKLLGGYNAGGYEELDDGVINTVKHIARQEGLVLDMVYSGKGMMGMLGEMEREEVAKDENVLFIHTGGIFGLMSYFYLFSIE